MKRTHLVALSACAVACFPSSARADQHITDAFAMQQEGATLTQVREELDAHAGDAAVDFALGAVDFLIAGEKLIQRCYQHGFMSTFGQIAPMTGGRASFLMWMANDNPKETTVADIEVALEEWIEHLEKAERTLAGVAGEFVCPIDLNAIRFDINADGETTAAESLRGFFALLPPQRLWVDGRMEVSDLVPEDLVVAFDRGDASWLRGYCHLLMGVGEWMLAHDASELFDHTGHIFFPKAKIKYDFLPYSTWSLERVTGVPTPAPFDFTDVLAFFANMRLPVDEPVRMSLALEHFQNTIVYGKDMWSHYDRETDNDREWIPNPKQTAAIHDVVVDVTMREAWLLFLDEVDDLLNGRKVLRFWRGDGSKGIDVVKVFREPRDFDLIFWIQGAAAAPYLREGEFTEPGTWAQLQEALDRRVFRFSFWFN